MYLCMVVIILTSLLEERGLYTLYHRACIYFCTRLFQSIFALANKLTCTHITYSIFPMYKTRMRILMHMNTTGALSRIRYSWILASRLSKSRNFLTGTYSPLHSPSKHSYFLLDLMTRTCHKPHKLHQQSLLRRAPSILPMTSRSLKTVVRASIPTHAHLHIYTYAHTHVCIVSMTCVFEHACIW